MKRLLKNFLYVLLLLLVTGIAACTDSNRIVDQNIALPSHNWTYANKFKQDVKIDDEKQAYNLYMNLRVTSGYKYSNIFVLISQTGSDKKAKTTRYEFTLANKEGEWLGEGSGNLYSYQVGFSTNYKFTAKGVYHFYIEQNMRDNPLAEVSDVGMRVEKVQQ